MLYAIGGNLRDLPSLDNEGDGEEKEDNEEEIELAKLSEDDEPGWVMGIIFKTVQQCMDSFRQKQMRMEVLMQPGWGYAANDFRGRDMKYGTAELMVPAVVKLQTEKTAATPSLTTFGEHMQSLDIVHRQSQMPQGTSRQGSIPMRLGSENL